MKSAKKKDVVIYQAKSGAIELRGDFERDTVWANLNQIAELFGRDKSVISRHIKNIFNSGELTENSVVAEIATTAADGKTYQVGYYNLDMILSIGYRVDSSQATKFRIWATQTLKQHLLHGYTIHKKRVAENYSHFLKAVEQVKALLPDSEAVDSRSALELVKLFASTWLSLDAYDKSELPKGGATKKQVKLTAEDLVLALAGLKQELVARKEATELFGKERQTGSVDGILGNIFQSFGGKDVYPTVEEKAAHLLYFVVKNHPFVDGNKRSGAFAFIWFLQKAKLLNTSRLSPEALTALTLLVAESAPKNKDQIIGLILLLLS